MAKIRITVPCSTSNLGPGFDFAGIALSLYNIYEFEENEIYEEVGFDGITDNLVLKAYKHIFDKFFQQKIPVKVTLVQNDIPIARGLGSSATAILAGMFAANYFLGDFKTPEQILKEAIEFEGHADNIMACYYGGLTIALKDDEDKYTHHKFDVNTNLKFNVIIPSYEVKTEDAREALPKEVSLEDVTFNASRAAMLTYAFELGTIDELKYILQDKIHEQYRCKFIKEWDDLKELSTKYDTTLNISGSGPTLLAISLNNDFKKEVKYRTELQVITLEVDEEGLILEETF